MAIDWNAEVIDQIDTHWTERLRPRLEGLTDDEYFWQPVPNCWTLSRRGESSAPISWGREALAQLDDQYNHWLAGLRNLGTSSLRPRPRGQAVPLLKRGADPPRRRDLFAS
jgi:hypothetical protein